VVAAFVAILVSTFGECRMETIGCRTAAKFCAAILPAAGKDADRN
jgi:hypothetical protein